MPDKIAEILLKVNAVMLRTKPPFRLVSGMLSPIYADHRLLISYAKEREFIVSSLIKLIKKNKIYFDGFAATATAGIPWAAWLAQKMKKPMIYVKAEKKEHGMENILEGKIQEGKTYLVVEDMVTTGGSSINTVNSVRDKGGVVHHCIAIFTYELEKAKNNFETANIRLLTLTSFTSLVKLALKQKYIATNQLSHIMDWKKNPEGWVSI
jgi:orotidine-5'-phosphate decarboxylase